MAICGHPAHYNEEAGFSKGFCVTCGEGPCAFCGTNAFVFVRGKHTWIPACKSCYEVLGELR